MGKFDGIIICSDIDGTLVNDNNEIPQINIDAIRYFTDNGGMFTLATGRVIETTEYVAKKTGIQLPVICHNGASLYDFSEHKYIKKIVLPDGVENLVEKVLEISPSSGVEVITENGVWVAVDSVLTEEHIKYEKLTPMYCNGYDKVPKPWLKVMFEQSDENTDLINNSFVNSEYSNNYYLVKSHKFYYEIINKAVSKGNMLVEFCKLLNLDIKKVIAIGDNENDIDMIKFAGVGATVSNANKKIQDIADIVLCNNNDGAVADLIYNKL